MSNKHYIGNYKLKTKPKQQYIKPSKKQITVVKAVSSSYPTYCGDYIE